jgi:general secretion pathway protein I
MSTRAPPTRRALTRAGFTLFEVVLSLGIFLGALAAISRIIDSGSRAAVRARVMNEAILRCESQMNQVVAGSVALQATDQAPFEDDTQWSWSLVLAEGPHVDLLNVQVVVSHARDDGQVDAEFALWRLMRNPELYLEAAAAEAETATTEVE